MHLVKSSYVQKEINMSEGLVNIDLPWHIPEYTYQQRTWMEVLELLQWWHGRIWLSMTPFDAGRNGGGHHANSGE